MPAIRPARPAPLPSARLLSRQFLAPRLPNRHLQTRLSQQQPCSKFSTRAPKWQQQQPRYEPPGGRPQSLADRIKTTSDNLKYSPIVAGLVLGLGIHLVFRKWKNRGKQDDAETGDGFKPKPRERVKPDGPWQVQVMATLPLKAVSRLWGKFNEIDLPVWLRVPGFKLYAWIFGANLDEVAESNLRTYPNLAAFFYRELKPGVRPLDPDPNSILSPADGRVVQYGLIDTEGEVEQVKGMTYSLAALLGSKKPDSGVDQSTSNTPDSAGPSQQAVDRTQDGDIEHIHAEEEFARVNGISYSLPYFFSGKPQDAQGKRKRRPATDQSTNAKPSSESDASAQLALSEKENPSWWSAFGTRPATPTALQYIVIYLAPGDYHRFHSPVSWVVEARRHFAGELYSVSPYLVRNLPGLFTLNERVVLLGRWRWGFFSYIPVGATNVGSIKINFDRELRTNSLTTDTEADRAAEEARERGEAYSGYAEATYAAASPLLRGHALKRGEEMGGFQLGSTIVLVFEAPKGRRPSLDEGYDKGRRGGWHWDVEKGQRIKMGQALGHFVEE